MALPEKDHFSLNEIAERWKTSAHDLKYYAEHDLLQMQAWCSEIVVKFFCMKRTEDGEIIPALTGVNSYNGYAILAPEELRKVFRNTHAPEIRKFKSSDNLCLMELFDSRASVEFSIDDLVVSRAERDRFELAHNIDCCCERAAQAARGDMQLPSFAGRPSVMHKVMEHFKERCVLNSVYPSLAKEADYLSNWAEQNISDCQAPKTKTIKNVLRDNYRIYNENLSQSSGLQSAA